MCRLRVILAVITLFVFYPAVPQAQQSKQEGGNSQRGSTLRVDSGTLFTADGVPIQLRQVTAKIVKHKPTPPPQGGTSDPSDPAQSSQVVTIEKGNVVLSSDSLSKLLNKKVGKNGKLSDLKVSTDPKKGEVHISGKAKKLIDVPFDLQGPVKATGDGKIELLAKSVKAADIPGLAGLLGLTVQKAAGKHAAKGVKTEHNTIIFNPDQLWGLPVHGSVTKVTVQQSGILLAFGAPGQGGAKTPAASHRATAKKPAHK